MNIQKLKQMLEEKQISQHELSRETGFSQPYINRVLMGRQTESVEFLKAVSSFFKVKIDDLV